MTLSAPAATEGMDGMRLLAGAAIAVVCSTAAVAGDRLQSAAMAAAIAGPDGFGVEYGNLLFGGTLASHRGRPAAGPAGHAFPDDDVTLHAGYHFGPALGYAVMAGDSRAVRSANRGGDGLFYGLGLALAVTEGLVLSGEALRRFGAEQGTDGAPSDDLFSMKVSFRF